MYSNRGILLKNTYSPFLTNKKSITCGELATTKRAVDRMSSLKLVLDTIFVTNSCSTASSASNFLFK